MKLIEASDFRKDLGGCTDDVHYTGTPVVITKRGKEKVLIVSTQPRLLTQSLEQIAIYFGYASTSDMVSSLKI